MPCDIKTCRTLKKVAKRLQLAHKKSGIPRDYLPVAIEFEIEGEREREEEKEKRLDANLLRRAAVKGEGKRDFLDHLQEQCGWGEGGMSTS